MADDKKRGATGSWDEDLHKDFNTPLSLLFADDKKDQIVGFDELGREIRVAQGGKKYVVGEVKAAPSIPEMGKAAYENLPPMEDWRLPTKDELKGVADSVVQGIVDVVKAPTNPDATLGDVYAVAGAMAAPGASKAFSAPDASTTRMFFGPESPKANLSLLDEAKGMVDKKFSDEEIWMRTGWWNSPNGWRFEVSDDKMKVHPEALDMVMSATDEGRGVLGTAENMVQHDDFWNALPRNSREARTRGTGRAQISKKPESGQYRQDGMLLASGMNEDELKSVILHELQHMEQDFAGKQGKGSNPAWTYNQVESVVEVLPRPAKEYLAVVRSLLDEHTSYETALKASKSNSPKGWMSTTDDLWGDDADFYTEKLDSIVDEIVQVRQSFVKELGEEFVEDLDSFTNLTGGYSAGFKYEPSAGIVQKKPYPQSLQDAQINAHNLYERDIGETEARLTQKRRNLTAWDRAIRHPKQDMDKSPESLVKPETIRRMMDRLQDKSEEFSKSSSKRKYAEGGMVSMDPSQNPVPPGALPEEVADDVDIKASKGEYIIPANVVRFLGLDKIEKMINKAKEQLSQLDEQGRIGGQTEDDLPFSPEELQAVEQADEQAAAPKMAAGGLVAPLLTPPNPTNELPFWMRQPQSQGVAQPAQTAAPAPPKDQKGKDDYERADSRPKGLAGSVNEWTPREFEKYATARNSPEQKFGQYMVSMIPGGGIMAKVRERYLERTVPKELENMIKTQKDLQGNPLDAETVGRLQGAYDNITNTPLDKFGRRGLLESAAKATGLIKKPGERAVKREEKRVERQKEKVQKDSIVNRVIDAVAKTGKSREEKDKDDDKSKSSSSSSKSSGDKSSTSKPHSSKTTSTKK